MQIVLHTVSSWRSHRTCLRPPTGEGELPRVPRVRQEEAGERVGAVPEPAEPAGRHQRQPDRLDPGAARLRRTSADGRRRPAVLLHLAQRSAEETGKSRRRSVTTAGAGSAVVGGGGGVRWGCGCTMSGGWADLLIAEAEATSVCRVLGCCSRDFLMRQM